MSDTPVSDQANWFLDEIVHPTVREFLSDLGSIRRGMLASIVVASLADHIFSARPELRRGAGTASKFREALASSSQDYALVRDVGDAAKHVTLSRLSARLREVQNIHQGVDLLLAESGDQILSEAGEPLLGWEGIVAAVTGATEVHLDEAICRAVAFIEGWMGR